MSDMNGFPDLSGFISVKEAAKILGISTKRLYTYIEEKRLPAFKPASRDYLIPRAAVEQFKLKFAGRPREKTPSWRVYRSGTKLVGMDIQVQVRSGQQKAFIRKLETIRKEQRHLLTGTMQRYIFKDKAAPSTVNIWLVWKDADMPDEALRERELAAFKAELADLVDWTTAQYSDKEGIIYT